MLLAATLGVAGQAADTDWQALKFLAGTWQGEESGTPGKGSGGFTFSAEAAGRVLVRRSSTSFPATQGRPAVTHEDYTVFFQEEGAVRATYVDNERHVIHYTVRAADPNIVCISEAVASAPRYRFTYTRVDKQRMKVKFEIAPPGKPEAFATHVEGVVRRQTPLRPVAP
jgi:ribosomal protein L27